MELVLLSPEKGWGVISSPGSVGASLLLAKASTVEQKKSNWKSIWRASISIFTYG